MVSTTRVRPPADSGQLPFSSLGVAKLVITGCPLSETPKPETQIAEGFNASSLVRFPWRVSSSSDVTDPLSLQQGETQDVSVSVEITRDPGQRSLALQGYVQVAAQGTRNLTITAVQVRLPAMMFMAPADSDPCNAWLPHVCCPCIHLLHSTF